MQGIANDRPGIAQGLFKNREKSIGRQDSNLRPSAPKALISHSAALGFQAISNFLLSSARFVVTNKVILVRNLSAK